MSSPLSVNQLDYSASPRLIFTANTPDRKGLAHKSYSIELPYTTNNNTLLDDIWGAGVLRPVSFEAVYNVGGVDIRGWLKLTEINRTSAKAIFISGNGYLWERMGQDRLRAIDMSDADIVLNKTNVLASETGTPFVLFDLTDRGAYKQIDGIDITDRFPALHLMELLTRIFSHYGVGVTIEGLNGDEYLLFMQESDIRNSDEWKQENYFEATVGATGLTATQSGTGGTFSVATLLDYSIEVSDDGNNFFADQYTVPESGTYRFKADYTLTFQRKATAEVSNVVATIEFRKNGSTLYKETLTVDLSVLVNDTITGTLDSLPIELAATDEIDVYATFSGDITDPGTWNVSIIEGNTPTGNRFYNELSRWYGAGSTIEIETVLPDMGVTEFIKATTEFLNMDIFYDDRLGIVTLRASNGLPYLTPITAWEIDSVVDEPKDTLLNFATDKVLPPANQYISVLGLDQLERKLSYSRTYIGRSGRIGIDIPVMWNSGRPTDVDQWLTPPEQKTRGALRILRKTDTVSASYVLTYGGDTTSSRETKTSHIAFEELDTYSLHLRDAARVEQYVTAFAKLDISKLQDLTYFKNTITLQDRFTGDRFAIQLLQAEQVDGEIFKLTGQTIALYNIYTSDSTRQTADTNTFQGSSGGGSSSTADPLPADIWYTSTDAQISGLDSKTTPIDADNIVIDDSADTNSKKRVTWANVKATLKTYFDFLYIAVSVANQLKDRLLEKTSVVDEDVIMIEDSANSFIKKFLKWTYIKATLKTYFDTLYVDFTSPQTITGVKTFTGSIFIRKSSTNGTSFQIDASNIPASKAAKLQVRSDIEGALTTWDLPPINGVLATFAQIPVKATGAEINTGTNDDKFVTPKAIADSNVFRTEKAAQISGLTEKTNPVAGDSFMIDDSAASNVKKKVFWSTLTSLFGLWTSVDSANIKTTKSIKVDAETSGTNDVVILANLTRKTTGTAAAGIGGALKFDVELANGAVVTTSYFISKVTNMTSGSEKSIFEVWNGGGRSFFINENNDLEMNALKSVVIQSANGTRYKLVVDNSGNLSTISA